MPALQFIAALALLTIYGVMTLGPMFGAHAADGDMKQSTTNIVLIVASFLFGSAVGSARKDDTNAALTAQLLTQAPVPPTAPAAPVRIDDSVPIKTQEVPAP
jgi:hypothetical protein